MNAQVIETSSGVTAPTVSRKKPQHSTTIYLPRKHHDFRLRAIRARVAQVFGVNRDTNLGKVSPYYNRLVDEDLFREGYFDEKGEPVESKLLESEAKIVEEQKKPKFQK